MNIIIDDENDRVYTSERGVPTIHLGDSRAAISTASESRLHGICFGEAVTDRTAHVDGLGVYIQILTDNPMILDEIAHQCHRAESALHEEARKYNIDSDDFEMRLDRNHSGDGRMMLTHRPTGISVFCLFDKNKDEQSVYVDLSTILSIKVGKFLGK